MRRLREYPSCVTLAFLRLEHTPICDGKPNQASVQSNLHFDPNFVASHVSNVDMTHALSLLSALAFTLLLGSALGQAVHPILTNCLKSANTGASKAVSTPALEPPQARRPIALPVAARVAVPSLSGLTLRAARRHLTAAGLTLVARAMEDGGVVSQRDFRWYRVRGDIVPAVGSLVEPGTAVVVRARQFGSSGGY